VCPLANREEQGRKNNKGHIGKKKKKSGEFSENFSPGPLLLALAVCSYF